MTDAPVPSPNPTSTSATVETDTTCLSCGYNLRGLALDGICPECGDEVERSLRGNLLRHADATWVRSLYRGLRTLHLSILVAIAALIGMIALSIGLGVFFFSAAPAPGVAPGGAATPAATGGMGVAGIIAAALGVVSGLCMLTLIVAYPIGWWLATRADPAESEARARERTILRVSAVLAMPVFAWWYWLPNSGVFGAISAPVIETSSHLCFAVIWTHLIFGVRQYAYVASRCAPVSAKDDRKLTKRLKTAKRYAKVLPGVILAFHWIAIVFSLTRPAGGAGGGAPVLGIGWGQGVGPFLMTLLTLDIVLLCGGVVKAVDHERDVARAVQLERLPDDEPPANGRRTSNLDD